MSEISEGLALLLAIGPEAEAAAERCAWYNPMLDPHCQEKMTDKMRAAVQHAHDTGEYDGGPLNTPDGDHPANLVSSLCADGLHRPAIDIDIPARLVPSSTPGHFHLYLDDLALDWPSYVALLGALVVAGVVEPAYLIHSLKRGQTLLRAPGCAK